jgi:hypothetical protein
MSNAANFVIAAWGLTSVTLAGYTMSVLIRGRRLSAMVPPAKRRWADQPES